MKRGLKHSYEIFQLGPDATPDQIKQVYRTLVKKWHPDRFSHDPQLQQRAQEKFIEINEAYSRLLNPSLDERRSSESRKSAPQPSRAQTTVTPRRPSSVRVMRVNSHHESSRTGRMQATPALTIIFVAVLALGTIIYAKLTMSSGHQPSTPYEQDTMLKISWQKHEALKHLDQAKQLLKDKQLDAAAIECDRGLRLDSGNIDLLKLKFEIEQIQLTEKIEEFNSREK
jgi:curved DNA-binding protein CbpA